MLKKLSFVLFLILINLSLHPTSVQARDPYPTVPRIKYINAPNPAAAADPTTMLKSDGKRSDIISFTCVDVTTRSDFLDQQKRSKYIYLNDLNIDSQQAAEARCAQIRASNSSPYNSLYTVVKQPYLKNNKQTSECLGKTYDANCYDKPIGDFAGDHPNAKGSWEWVTPLVYLASGGPQNACGPNKNQACDCQYTPLGPRDTWEIITWGTRQCVSPPYSTSGPWWNWFTSEMDGIKSGIDLNKITSVGVYFGIDGEGRPFKSQDAWVNRPVYDRFFQQYVPAVINEVKKRYPGKVIRAHFTRDLNFFFENDIQFHWESLNSDGTAEFLYKGLNPMGYDQIYTNYFYRTNTLGLNPDWPPFYQDILNALSKHSDGLTGFVDLFDNGLYLDGRGDFLKFAGSYIGKDINDTPGVWTALRDTMIRKGERYVDLGNRDGGYYSIAENHSGKYGDYNFYLYRAEDLEGNKTVPVRTDELPAGTSSQIYNWKLPAKIYQIPDQNQYVGRKNAPGNNYLSFDIDDGYRFTKKSGVSFDVRIVYLDVGTDTFKFQYKDAANQTKEYAINKTDTKLWQEKKFTLNEAYFNNNMSDYPYPTDFRIETNGSTLHLVEVIGKGNVTQLTRPRAQVSCDLVKNETDDPKEGLYSVGLNQNIKVKARLVDNNGNPLPNERVMFTYNSEWNWAKSIKTNGSGVAFYDLSTANNPNRSGFLGDGGRIDWPSWYSMQVFYPGNDKYQPSRNDCIIPIYSSTASSTTDARMKIVSVDTSKVATTGKVTASYQILSSTNSVLDQGQKEIGKKDSFFASDPNAQTVMLSWIDDTKAHRYAFNNITLSGSGTFPTEPPYPTSGPSQPPSGTVAGDTNGNNCVGARDLGFVMGHYQTSSQCTPTSPHPTPGPATNGDFNHDNCVDDLDLSVVSSKFTYSCNE